MLALRRSDRGSILLIAIVLVIIVMGMAGSYLVISNVQAHRVSEQIESDRARSAAETGIDHMRTYLLSLVDPSSADPAAAWDTVLGTNGGTPDWARDVSTPDGSYTVRVLDNDDGDGNLLDDLDGAVLLEAVGYGTKDGANGAAHVIRCIVILEVNDPTDNFAIITGGDLEIFGNEIVSGSLGNVHTNANLTLQGSASIAHDATASGTTTVVGNGTFVGDDIEGNQAIVPIAPVVPADYRPYANYILTSDGRVLDGATGAELFNFNATSSLPPVPAEVRTARLRDGRMTMYGAGFGMPNDRNANNAYGNSGGGVSGANSNGNSSNAGGTNGNSGSTGGDTSGGSTGGTTGGTTGGATSGGGSSGSTGGGSSGSTGGGGSSGSTGGGSSGSTGGGSSGSTGGGGSSGSAGGGGSSGSAGGGGSSGSAGGGNQQLTYNGFTWSAQNGWSTATSGWVNGMYYVEGDITFNHGGTSDAPWDVTIVAEGSIATQGNPYLSPYFNDAELFVAGEDVYMRGTGSNASVEGLILAHEQVSLDGNITFRGRIVAESAVNVDGSRVDRNTNELLSDFGGSVHVEYNGYMPRSLVSEYRLPVRSWQEDIPTNQGIQTLGNNAQVINTMESSGGTYSQSPSGY